MYRFLAHCVHLGVHLSMRTIYILVRSLSLRVYVYTYKLYKRVASGSLYLDFHFPPSRTSFFFFVHRCSARLRRVRDVFAWAKKTLFVFMACLGDVIFGDGLTE